MDNSLVSISASFEQTGTYAGRGNMCHLTFEFELNDPVEWSFYDYYDGLEGEDLDQAKEDCLEHLETYNITSTVTGFRAWTDF